MFSRAQGLVDILLVKGLVGMLLVEERVDILLEGLI